MANITIPGVYARTLAVAAILLAGCTDISPEARISTAQDIATSAYLQKRVIATDPFTLTLFERIERPNAEATIYIEGDGLAWIGRHEPSSDPTPINPVALRLAAADPADNVIYMARPCQYSEDKNCKAEHWTSRRLSPEELKSENAALDDIKARYDITGLHLVGYSGGGAVAVLLAGMRSDVLSLRTVAGNLDPALFSKMHDVSPPAKDTLSPMNVAAKIAQLPQLHFVGSEDTIVTMKLYESFSKAMGPYSRSKGITVENVGHNEGWEKAWPNLLIIPTD